MQKRLKVSPIPVLCPACSGKHLLRDCPSTRERSLLRSEVELADLPFEEAANKWLSSRLIETGGAATEVRYIAANTERTYRDYIWALGRFFAGTRLRDIHDGMLSRYQDRRSVNGGQLWFKPCGQNHLRKEVGFLIMVMRSAGVWSEDLDEAFAMLPTESVKVPRVPEPEMREKIFRIMASKDEWLWIYHWAVLSRRLTASTFELRMAWLECIDLRRELFHVHKHQAKCHGRVRSIPMETEDCLESAEWLKRRAHRLGAFDARHFLFPYGVNSKQEVDVTKPMTACAMKNSMNRIKRRAGLRHLRPYDFRHWGMTELAERGSSIHEIMSFAGHMTPDMQRIYIDISAAAKRLIAQRAKEASAFDKKRGPRRVEEWEVRVPRSA